MLVTVRVLNQAAIRCLVDCGVLMIAGGGGIPVA
jgi:carbamate kinase